MAACVEYRQEEMSSGETKEKGDDLSAFVDFTVANQNLDLLQKSNQIQDSESENKLRSETVSIIHSQDSGSDDILNSLNNITDYEWLLSPPRHLVHSLETEEQAPLSDHIPISNGQSTSPESKLENDYPSGDGSSTTNISPKLQASSFNIVKSSSTIRRPSPQRKAPSTGSRSATPTTRAKPSRSSTPTSRATVTAGTKPVAPTKRSTTPKPRPPVFAATTKSTSRSSTPSQRPSILPVASKSASRSSTPSQRSSITDSAKSASRSSTPSQRPSIIDSAKSASRSSTPSQRPSITDSAKSASRLSTPSQRPSITDSAKSASRSSTPSQRPSMIASVKSASRSSTPTQQPNRSSSARGSSHAVKSRPSKNPPEMHERPASGSRVTPGPSTVKLAVTEMNLKAVPKRATCSPSRGHGDVKYGMVRGRGHLDGDDHDDVNPVLMGTKMVERVVNMRKLAPPRHDQMSNENNTSGKLLVSQDKPGFGRSLSRKSFDMALRHLDIRRSMPGNKRATITKVPASSVYSVRQEPTKTRTTSASGSPLATSSSSSSDHSETGHSYHQSSGNSGGVAV